jgi:xanthine/CO dehydrogenase XdhC/CoxF family maturation factor
MSPENPLQHSELAVFESTSEWLNDGHRVFLFTVARTWGSAPRPVGSIMALKDDGRVAGSVSGGCLEDDLIGSLRRDGLPDRKPSPLKYGLDADEANRLGLPCGGTLQLIRETLDEQSSLLALLHRLRHGRLVRRVIDMAPGTVTLSDSTANDSARVFTTDSFRPFTVRPGGGCSSGLVISVSTSRRWRELCLLGHHCAGTAHLRADRGLSERHLFGGDCKRAVSRDGREGTKKA